MSNNSFNVLQVGVNINIQKIYIILHKFQKIQKFQLPNISSNSILSIISNVLNVLYIKHFKISKIVWIFNMEVFDNVIF